MPCSNRTVSVSWCPHVFVMTVTSPWAHAPGTRSPYPGASVNTIDGIRSGKRWTSQARHAPWRQALGAISTRIGCDGEIDASAVLEHGGPWPARRHDTRDCQGMALAPKGMKKPPPVRGRAVSGSWYHPTSRPHRTRPPQHGATTRDAAAQ